MRFDKKGIVAILGLVLLLSGIVVQVGCGEPGVAVGTTTEEKKKTTLEADATLTVPVETK